jgi:hypothetical protein
MGRYRVSTTSTPRLHGRDGHEVTGEEFGVDVFLSQPLTARIATNGPTVRPTWFLWEDQAFWILTGPWASLLHRVLAEPVTALVVDECDLGADETRWDQRFLCYLLDDPAQKGTRWLRLRPDSLIAKDLSYTV